MIETNEGGFIYTIRSEGLALSWPFGSLVNTVVSLPDVRDPASFLVRVPTSDWPHTASSWGRFGSGRVDWRVNDCTHTATETLGGRTVCLLCGVEWGGDE